MRDDARAEADGQQCRCGAGDSCALAPRGLLRCGLDCRSASSHGLVTGLVVDRRARDALQGCAGERASPLLLCDGRHLRRFHLGYVRGQDFGLIRGLQLRLGQARGALTVTCHVLVVLRHGDAPFC